MINLSRSIITILICISLNFVIEGLTTNETKFKPKSLPVKNKTVLITDNMMVPLISDKLVFNTRDMDEDELKFLVNLENGNMAMDEDMLHDLSEESSGEFEINQRPIPKINSARSSFPDSTDKLDVPDNKFGPTVVEKGWIQYKYDKSFILLNRTVNQFEAQNICEQFNINGDVGAQLAIPQTEEEQQFLNFYLFKLSNAMKNVWIGQLTINYRNNSFNNGFNLYSNWAKGMPTMTKSCIQIRSPLTIYNDMDDSIGGKWEDVSCVRKNLILCEKPQRWSEHQYIRILTELKKDVERLKHKRGTKPVPLGFIYTQLPNQTSPDRLWPRYQWQDISQQYSELYYPIEVDGSRLIGEIAADNSIKPNRPHLTVRVWKRV